MEPKDLLLPLLASLWGCTTLVFTATAEVNRLRDIVILGHDKGHVIPPGHLDHVMRNDWKPMVACVIVACFGFSLVSGLSPLLLDKDHDHRVAVWFIPIGVAIYTAFMGFIWIPAAFRDWRAMKAACELHRRQEAEA